MTLAMPPERIDSQVLIIGAGAAGLRAAIELAARGKECLLLGKRRHGDAHTSWAAGGINATFGHRDPQDRWQLHAADTIREGHFICQPQAVELLAREAPARVLELAEWGCDFARTEDGRIDQRYFGAQSFRRTCFVGDRTGYSMLQALVDQAAVLQVPWREHIYITALLTDPGSGRVCGALGLDLAHNRPVVIACGAVLLAAGGYTSIFGRTSSRRDENSGDAVALAYRAGATLRDMEMVQFHPTGMVAPPEMAGRLVTEAVRGEGGRLFNAAGERFMARYAPQEMELAARDVVARAIFEEIQNGRGTASGGVLLDISHVHAERIRQRLPAMVSRFAEQQIDITRQPMEVAPTAHYAMGGIAVDFATGATSLPGLFAAGEATAGLHGANRLGGNSLAETVVFGRRAGVHLAEEGGTALPPAGLIETLAHPHLEDLRRLAVADGRWRPGELLCRLGRILDEGAGILRDGEGLRRALAELEQLREPANDLRVGEEDLPQALDLRCMLLAAEALLRSALAREESRGAHFRRDFPQTDSRQQRNILCRRGADEVMELFSEPVPAISDELQAAIDEKRTLEYGHLE
jgi:succinate dehydrogenase / fumarate reductase, flavoprotein subunit